MIDQNELQMVLNDTDWHKVGAAEFSWALNAISGTAVDFCQFTADVIPDAYTEASFILGGSVNAIRTDKGLQGWVRARSASLTNPVTIVLHDNDQEGFDETTYLRMAIVELQTRIADISIRLIKLDQWKASAIEDWQILRYIMETRLDLMTKTLTEMTNTDLALLDNIHGLRERIPELINRVSALETTTAKADDVEQSFQGVILSMANNTNISVELLDYLVRLDFQLAGYRKELETMAISVDPAILEKFTTIQEELDIYWALCTKLVSLRTAQEITNAYNAFLVENNVPTDMIPRLEFVRDQALAIVSTVAVNIDQESALDSISTTLNTPIVSETLDAASMKKLLTGA